MASDLTPIRILLADDHALFSDGLALQLTQADPRVNVVGQVFRGADVLPAVHQHSPHVVLPEAYHYEFIRTARLRP